MFHRERMIFSSKTIMNTRQSESVNEVDLENSWSICKRLFRRISNQQSVTKVLLLIIRALNHKTVSRSESCSFYAISAVSILN